jgi:thioredoxin reductase (NADPH)
MQDDYDAFPTLSPSDLATLETLGSRRTVSAGEYLFREGDAGYDFFVVLSGAVEIVTRAQDEDHVIVRHERGRFVGELNLLSGLRVFLSARVAEPGEVLVIPVETLRRVISTSPVLGDTILKAFIARRSMLMREASTTVRVVGSRFSPEALRVREFLSRTCIPHEWVDADRDTGVGQILGDLGIGAGELPVVITAGAVLRRATPGSLAEYLGLTVDSLPERCFDLVVVGGGPAGLAAAVYGASEGLQTLGLEMTSAGGQAGTSSRIENYLGFPTGISGNELTQRAVVQAEKFGAHLTVPCAATSLREEAGHIVVRLSDGSDVAARAVIAATGAHYRRLDVPRLQDFEGNGIYYAATSMEAKACAPSPVVVVGGGNSAGQAALYLAEGGSRVTIVIRGADLARTMSSYLVDRVEAEAGVDLHVSTQVTGLEGDRSLTAVQLTGKGTDTLVDCVGLFSFIGADPASQWLSGCAALNEHGFVLTDTALGEEHLDERWASLGRRPLSFETNFPGLFAVGDLRSGSTKRVAAAVGEGSAAVRSVHEYLAFAH